jgi:predicted dienelactone hydrolase
MRLSILALVALVYSLAAGAAQAYQIGHRVVTYQDPARGNRSIATDIYYPADTAGNNVPVSAPPPGGFPVVAFGHGFTMGSNVYGFVEDLAADGYVVILPATETGLAPNHTNFGEDLAYLVNRLKTEGATPASFLFGAVAAKGAVGGHSMGGGASYLGALGDAGIDAVFGFAAANTNPSAISAAAGVTVPTLVLAAGNDCVAPPDDHQIPIYQASASSCAAYVEIDGASHCQFNDYNFTCDLGEFCSASIPRGTQHALTIALLRPWLDAVLKNAPFAWDEFQAEIAAHPAYIVAQDCPVAPEPACSNGIDDDGDGLGDFPEDSGCDDVGDASERSPAFVCDDGVDQDGDGLADFPADPGCATPSSTLENPKCNDGIDNDLDGGTDWDGTPPDPQCGTASRNREQPGACGFGAEIALALAAIAIRRRSRT